jgi:hypothetical protein
MTHKNREKLRNFMFFSAECLGIAIYDQKNIYKNFQVYFFLTFFVSKTLDPDPDSLEMLDPDSMNSDPQH